MATLRCPSCGGEIPIEMGMAEQCVTHRAANAPGLESGVLEALDDAAHAFGWVQAGRCRHESNITLS